MRRNSISFYLLVSIVFVFASCLGDSDNTIVYPGDAAITSFTLGTLKQYVTTKAKDGSDSTYTKDVTGSAYKFYIDQVNREIYNPDSLPYGTDAKHVLCTVTSKNSASVTIKKIDNDTLVYYSSTDTIDFTVPRTFKVFSLDGTNTIDYTVKVNVQQECPDTLFWTNTTANTAFADVKAMKALACNGKIFVVTSNGLNSGIYSTDETDGTEWAPMAWNINGPVPDNAYENIVSNGTSLYLYAGNAILRSTDGNYWEKTADARLGKLVAVSDKTLFAIDDLGMLVSSSNEGVTWTAEALDDDASLLPTQDLSYCEIYSRVNEDTKTIKLIGNRDLNSYPSDTYAQVWGKLVEGTNMGATWMYTNPNDLTHLMLPRLGALQVVVMGNRLLAAGSQGVQGAAVPSKLYYSDDGGIYWYQKNSYSLPDQQFGGAFAMTADSHNNIWMVCGGDGNVWKGHITNDGKSKVPTSITE
ncbi:MAG: exo-alpha-sialidase [Prevotella sp.]|nr:exo-alpha-sialidase [Prevotella sp.]